jgi:hypothetical protein
LLGYLVKYIEVPGVGHSASVVYGREMEIFNWFYDHPMWGTTHLLLGVQPNQDSYAKGQSLALSVTALNQDNPHLDSTLTLTVTGPDNYYYYDFQTVNVTTDSVGEFGFSWVVPGAIGNYVVEVGLIPAQLTAYDAAWIKVA